VGFGQEKKNEHKVKVIIADKSGTKVMIDTIFTGSDKIDSIITKDGSVIYIGKNDPDNQYKQGKQIKVIASIDKDGEKTESRYIYFNDATVDTESGDDVFDIIVSEEDSDNDIEKTKYVIAKNGITVSVEGNDELKTKELIKEIERVLDINKDEPESGQAFKEVDKNTVKKK
jgi:hypothetical protein